MIKVIKELKRLANSDNGNPNYIVVFHDGMLLHTAPDSQIGNDIGNPEYQGQQLRITTKNASDLVGAEPIGRPINEIAKEIRQDWEKPYFGAVPYLKAMHQLVTIDDKYVMDDAKSIVRYFLSNANTWRGETARRVKAELKGMIKW